MKVRVKIENQTYDVELGELNARPILASIEGETFEVFPDETQIQAPVSSAASLATTATASVAAAIPAATPIVSGSGAKVISAPIPGTIVALYVNAGDTVEFGKEVCTLEAMKMKNSIRATRSGKIAAVHVSVGQLVRHGQTIMEFTD